MQSRKITLKITPKRGEKSVIRLCFPALVVLCRCALTFSTISGDGVKQETVPCSFSSVFFGCNLSCGSSTPWDIAF